MSLLDARRGIDNRGLAGHGYSIMHPPIPHCGSPQVSEDAGLQGGKSWEPDVWAAGTLSNRSSFELWQSGQRGFSLPRTSTSN